MVPPATLPEPTFRTDPPYVADERAMLDAWLDFHRGTLLWKCDGLSDAELKRASVEPSGLTLLGLVRHMAEVERGWFIETFAQEPEDSLYCSEEEPDGDFDLVADADAATDLATFRTEVEACRSVVAGRGLDEASPHRRHGRPVSLRWIYLHMIEEYARHNGHADLLRERIDGVTGD